MGYYTGLNERGETYQEWAERTGQIEPSAECIEWGSEETDVVTEASQRADTERAMKVLGTLVGDLGYTCYPAGNGYYAIYRSTTARLKPGDKLLKFGRLDEVAEWLRR